MPPFELLRVDLVHQHQIKCLSLPNWKHPSIYSSPPSFCAILTAIPRHLFFSTQRIRHDSGLFQLLIENHHHSHTYLGSIYIDDPKDFYCQCVLRPSQRQLLLNIPLDLKRWEKNTGLIQVTWQQVIEIGKNHFKKSQIEDGIMKRRRNANPIWSPMEAFPSIIFEFRYGKEEILKHEWTLAQEVFRDRNKYNPFAKNRSNFSCVSPIHHEKEKKVDCIEILSSSEDDNDPNESINNNNNTNKTVNDVKGNDKKSATSPSSSSSYSQHSHSSVTSYLIEISSDEEGMEVVHKKPRLKDQ